MAVFRFLGRAISGHYIHIFVGAALMLAGFTREWAAMFLAQPYWWLVHPLASPVLEMIGALFLGYAAFAQSRIEVQIPDYLMRKDRISFLETATALSKLSALNLDQPSALQKLVRAMWRGDFESASGQSRLGLAYSGITKLVGDRWLSVAATADGEESDDVDFSPPLHPCGRRELLQGWELGLQEVYPSLMPLLPALRDPSQAWSGISSRIDFGRLERTPIGSYDEIFRRAYLEPLTMSRRDLVRWFRRLRGGRYDVR